ncbi:MAG: GlsB/YeaQ/YmgE family stress response membrane protein [Magnetospiraceae bacterium]
MSINLSLSAILMWVIVGGIAGWIVGMIARSSKGGFGPWGNVLMGILGGVIGGALFRIFNIHLGLPVVTLDLNTIVAGVVGGLIMVIALVVIRGR